MITRIVRPTIGIGMLLFLATCFSQTVPLTFTTQGFEVGFSLGGGINYYQPKNNTIAVRDAAHASFAWGFHISKFFTPHIGVQLGYMNYGFYENDGSGTGFCDMSGNCNYTHASLNPLVFKSQLTVNNEVENQATYLVLLLRQPIFTNQSLLLKLGGAYSFARIHSFVTVNPQVGGIGPTIMQVDRIHNRDYFAPFVAIAWRMLLNQTMVLTTEFNWNGLLHMGDDRGFNGNLYPMAIMMGLSYRFK